MHLGVRVLLQALTTLGTLASLGFYVLSACGLVSFLRERRERSSSGPPSHASLPPVSILKPLKGTDPEQWESFCSHCEQDYPEFQLIFGVSDPGDPAIDLVRRLQKKYPDRQIELIVCERTLGTNIKVSNLAQMLSAARHEVLLVNDSDIRVPPDYLRRVILPLRDASVGLVTCLYRGIASRTLGSRLEAVGISTDFAIGVLSARLLEKGLRFGLGSTLALRRKDLEAIGSFEAIVDYLADDYELGHRVSALGKKVELSEVVVDTFLPPYSFPQFLSHQIRWARTVRDARPWGYAGLPLTYGLPWALAMLIAAKGGSWAWALLALTLFARLAFGLISASGVLHDRHLLRNILLLPLRDLIAPFVWVASFAGNSISWRGDVFYLKDGRLIRAGTN